MIASIENNESLQVLMVGNNPIELGRVLERLQEVKSKKIITQFAFDLKSSLQCLGSFHPSFIVIDDNIGKSELNLSVQAFANRRKTKHIPITIIKNSNYEGMVNYGPLNYVLKSNLTGELLYRALTNSMKYRKAQDYLKLVYRKRKGQLRHILGIGH
ncbi:MAG: hypothetical protein ACKVOQ_03775 [Cyclobacteriaceae bacterium]|jgi:hypothetical protein